jgi:hypothetical protein
MCFLRKRTTKNIDRIENESDELKNLFDEKIAPVPPGLCLSLYPAGSQEGFPRHQHPSVEQLGGSVGLVCVRFGRVH